MAPRKIPGWDALGEDKKKLYVTLLRNDGHTDEAIGTFFGTTKGSIVGFRHRRLSELTFGTKATKNAVDQKRFWSLLKDQTKKPVADADTLLGRDDIVPSETKTQQQQPPEADSPQPQEPAIAPSAKTRSLVLAATEATQCTYIGENGHRCGREMTDPTSRRCDFHPL